MAPSCYSGDGRYIQDSNDWHRIAEATLPLKCSGLITNEFIQIKSKNLSYKIVTVTIISLLVNLALATVSFYLAYINNSPSTSAFAADCTLDLISSIIVLWRYYGDLSGLYLHAREQIACIYLGVLFEISAIAIAAKAINDIALANESESTNGLMYLSIAALVTCTALSVVKYIIYRSVRDESMLLDVINTVISVVFAISLLLSQGLMSVNRALWYFDPIMSIFLAICMSLFGLKVIHQNFNTLKPVQSHYYPSQFIPASIHTSNNCDQHHINCIYDNCNGYNCFVGKQQQNYHHQQHDHQQNCLNNCSNNNNITSTTQHKHNHQRNHYHEKAHPSLSNSFSQQRANYSSFN